MKSVPWQPDESVQLPLGIKVAVGWWTKLQCSVDWTVDSIKATKENPNGSVKKQSTKYSPEDAHTLLRVAFIFIFVTSVIIFSFFFL